MKSPLPWQQALLTVALLAHAAHGQTAEQMMAALTRIVTVNERLRSDEPPDTPSPAGRFDFIVVGAGSAGCVLANRLTEVADWRVLLIEAGSSENAVFDIPLVASTLSFTRANWEYTSEPSKFSCLGANDGRCPVPRGKVMGGSSVLNYMVYTRGDARDYDNWEAMGNQGWGWKDVYPYFLKSEDFLIDANWVNRSAHRLGGYQTVDDAPYKTKIVQAFVKAGRELGYKVKDYNDGNIEGFSFVQTTTKNGVRMSTSRAFLHPIKKRPNLTVVKNALVARVIIENKRAVAVEYIKNDRTFTVAATKEVILSAGAINSPQILMLSGIGPAADLRKLKIPVITDASVGYNLQDHPVIGDVIYVVKGKPNVDMGIFVDSLPQYLLTNRGPLTIPGGLEGVAFVDVFNSPGNQIFPNLEIQMCATSPLNFPHIHAVFGTKPSIWEAVYPEITEHTYLMFMNVLRPKSRGRVWLKSRDPRAKPAIDLGFLSHPDDVKVLVKGVELAQNLSRTLAFEQFRPALFDEPIPPCAQHGRGSVAYWECHARHLTVTNYHQSGTVKMGPRGDESAVVDPRLRVRGVKGLRVIDASIFPQLMSAHTNAPTIMVAEKGADMIKEDWGISDNNVIRKRRS